MGAQGRARVARDHDLHHEARWLSHLFDSYADPGASRPAKRPAPAPFPLPSAETAP